VSGSDPEHQAVLAHSVGLALLVVLETLSPAERLAFVLHLRDCVRRDRLDRGPLAGRRENARQSGPAADPWGAHDAG
jgi:RNA polymerase sigma-70 factor (ECF subfamily)